MQLQLGQTFPRKWTPPGAEGMRQKPATQGLGDEESAGREYANHLTHRPLGLSDSRNSGVFHWKAGVLVSVGR